MAESVALHCCIHPPPSKTKDDNDVSDVETLISVHFPSAASKAVPNWTATVSLIEGQEQTASMAVYYYEYYAAPLISMFHVRRMTKKMLLVTFLEQTKTEPYRCR